MAWAGIILGGYQAIKGASDKKEAKDDAERLLKQRKAYQTPIELYKQSNALEQQAQSGFAPEELSYLTNQSNQALGDALFTSESLGGDPNNLSALFNSHVDQIMNIEGADHNQRMQKFNSYINSLSTIADSKTAEQVSQDNLLKDQLAAAQGARTEAAKTEQSGINLGLSSLSTMASNNLYGDAANNDPNQFNKAYGSQGSNAYDYAKKNKLSFDQYDKQYQTNLSHLSYL